MGARRGGPACGLLFDGHRDGLRQVLDGVLLHLVDDGLGRRDVDLEGLDALERLDQLGLGGLASGLAARRLARLASGIADCIFIPDLPPHPENAMCNT